jgi:glycosyltransferase involved in cell wall biosynthesis
MVRDGKDIQSRSHDEQSRKKVLYICHNHPAVRPGGAEAYAYELFQAMRSSSEFEAVFLAKGGPPLSYAGRTHRGTPFSPVDGRTDEYFFYTDGYTYDWLYGTVTDKQLYTRHFREFLASIRPAIVHFQHTLFLGYDMLREVRNTLPEAGIVYTLHEYLPICHRKGQMLRTNDELCLMASPRRCNECFPDVAPQSFFLRERFIKSHFQVVDRFLAPSHFLLERFVDWGIPRHKIQFEEYGRLPIQTGPAVTNRPRNRFAFFGQLNHYKGINILLRAMEIIGADVPQLASATLPVLESLLAAGTTRAGTPGPIPGAAVRSDSKPHLWVHGANLEVQPGEFQNEFRQLLEATRANVTFAGRYNHWELPKLMENIDWVVVPSLWWENSPLVIQEAFMFGKPVICSDIGGMAEKITHNVNGLHFRVGDPASLAETIRRATHTPDLWHSLRDNIPSVYPMEETVTALTTMYQELLHQPSTRS